MTEYQKQAQDFLAACNATMKIEFQCVDVNRNWNDNSKRNKYCFTITTPRGTMYGDFWDSIYHTEVTLMTLDDYFRKTYRRSAHASTYSEQNKAKKALAELKEKAVPTVYDILSCLTKYDPGTMNDFFSEMGYEVHDADDIFCFLNTYNAVVKEYRDLCRIFTEEQMEMLREIQ